MRYGIRVHGGATCLVSTCLGVPEKMRKDIREISKLECQPTQRGQGYATGLLKDICKEADRKRMILVLTVDPFGDSPPLTREQLTDWYQNKFDFHVLQHTPLILVRMFNPFPESDPTAEVGLIITEGVK